MRIITGTLGAEWVREVDSIVVPKDQYVRIEGYILRRYSSDQRLLRTLEHYRKRRLVDLFARFPQMATDLALQRGKRIKPVTITGGNVLVVPERFERLVSSFVHIIRNMVDHGIERPAEREGSGKPPEGTIQIDIREGDDQIVFQLRDDGSGIDLERVVERARSKGLIGQDEQPSTGRLLELIFHEDFSTAASVTMISGRGYGLAAVRQAVREAGGKITISTRAGKGTTFTVTVPGRRPRSKAQ